MAGAAVRGISRILRKGLRKAPVLGGRVRGTPTKAGLTARRAALRGETTAEKYRKLLGPVPKGVKKKTLKSEIERVKPAWIGLGLGVAGTLTVQQALKKQKEVKAEGKAKETKAKKALTRALDRHKKSTKEAKEKRGKHHG